MVLKALFVQGFKSFPDKTEIQFGNGITAIVGPNGSGKSNISDAIRWVMGEQSSRMLRGAKMEDVIFGGTQKRGPVGFAEVSLLIDNSDSSLACEYADVMVTRRYYRSGESEYYLNRKQVRLRDLHELFMDTGLGRDGYSIIGQGKIDDILSLKSEDRREIFEEAAGITKYRYRREEASRKLEATEENLVRIRDILQELEERVEPLQKQAEKAKIYLQVRDELKGLECALWQRGLAQNQQSRQQNEKDLLVIGEQLAEQSQQRQDNYAKLEDLTGQMQQLDSDIEAQRGVLSQQEELISQQKSRQAVLEENIRLQGENIRQLEEEMEKSQQRAQSLQEQMQERRDRQSQLENERQLEVEQQEQLRERQLALEQSDREGGDQLTRLRQERESAQSKLAECRSSLSALESGKTQWQERKLVLEQQLEELSEQLKEQQQSCQQYQQEHREQEEALQSLENVRAGLALKQGSREQKLRQSEEEKNRLTADLSAKEKHLQLLKNMQRDYDGFSRAVKMVMSRSKSGMLTGIRGPVSALIRTDKQYITAVETALGAAVSHIVTETAQDSRRAIEYLKGNDGGRATFQPMDTIRPQRLQEKSLPSMAGFVQVASDLVECQQEYRDIVESLLGRTAVFDTLEHAMAASRKVNGRVRMVTLDGQVMNVGGSMTGGSAAKSSGVLSRAGEIEELESQLVQLTQRQSQAEKDWQSAREEVGALRFQLETLQQEQTQARQETIRLQATLEQQDALIVSLKERQQALVREKAQGDSEQQQRSVTQQQLQSDSAAWEQQAQRLLEEQQGLLEGQDELSRQLEKLRAEQSESAAHLASLDAEQEQLTRALSEFSALEQDISGDEGRTRERIAESQSEIDRARKQIDGAGETMAQLEEKKTEIGKTISNLAQRRMEHEARRTRLDKETQALTEQLMAIDREKTRLETRQTQLESEEHHLLDQMWEKYELTPSTVGSAACEIESVTAAEKEIASLRGRIRALGNVNLDAVEEYQAVQERYQFVSTQKDDVEKAKADLEKTIEELLENMKTIFTRQFRLLNQYFGETFAEIFGGGHGELILEDPSDVLGCGIEIRVCPPGKAVKTITLLSGGEKAFVAIALYFAIMKVRPTPFCVLDEIEAALDDVNVTRFAQYLRRLSDQTQFIVITHRRGTMEEADMLYGVTMQEQGVSKLLMLNINQVEQELHMSI